MSSHPGSLRKILYVAMRYDYGRKEQGTSFEFNNFYRTLGRLVPQVVEFDSMTLMQEHGREAMNRMLVDAAEREQPDLIFFCLFTDEILPETIAKLTGQCTTYNWFCDDHWRFSNFSKFYAPHFSFVSTTDPDAVPRYKKIGYDHALITQWACNHYDYRLMPDVKKEYDVTFIGQPHGNRKRVVAYLRSHGINIQPFGRGWENGRVSQEEMIRIFNASKINLNLSNSSWNIHTIFRGQQQIKGRNFEIPGSGGFILTNHVQGIEQSYDIGKEIVCFRNRRDLLHLIGYYLSHETEREQIARAGYERTLREHTYERRFRELFTHMGFSL
ncbi:MAG: glycosyltransferase [Ignavibacteriae bacterium]|nr:glycosyltransferase [Ignavibacteriota bacterium]